MNLQECKNKWAYDLTEKFFYNEDNKLCRRVFNSYTCVTILVLKWFDFIKRYTTNEKNPLVREND